MAGEVLGVGSKLRGDEEVPQVTENARVLGEKLLAGEPKDPLSELLNGRAERDVLVGGGKELMDESLVVEERHVDAQVDGEHAPIGRPACVEEGGPMTAQGHDVAKELCAWN